MKTKNGKKVYVKLKVSEISCGIVYFNLWAAFFSKMITFKVKFVYVGFSIAICNFFLKEKSRRCSNNQRPTAAEIVQLADWPAPLSIISRHLRSTSHKRTAAAQLP